ncbi:hypothetical protein [Undibacterium sp.]|uniref:hypothetical protein n=1 Tax=Undibacterium sp. TaxID=1914977 RepID=UPI003750808D
MINNTPGKWGYDNFPESGVAHICETHHKYDIRPVAKDVQEKDLRQMCAEIEARETTI